jgi:hypothetical protein
MKTPDEMTPDELLEEGVGLISRALFRLAQYDKSSCLSAGEITASFIKKMTVELSSQKKEST